MMKLLIVQFSANFSFVDTNIFLSILFTNTVSVCSVLKAIDHVFLFKVTKELAVPGVQFIVFML